MSSKTTKSESGGISIGGNVNTAGGHIAGRDVNNVSVNIESKTENISNLFSPIYKTIEEQRSLTGEKREKLNQRIQTLEDEASKTIPDKNKVGKLLTDIAKMSPDILEVVLATISNPLIGMATIARKVSEKAKEQTRK
jgi:hypothetical protein